MTSTEALIQTIEAHGHSATEFKGAILATSAATMRGTSGDVITFDVTEVLEPTKAAVMAWLGY